MTNAQLDKIRNPADPTNPILDDILPHLQAEVSKDLQPLLKKYCVTKISSSINSLLPESIYQLINCYI